MRDVDKEGSSNTNFNAVKQKERSLVMLLRYVG